MRLITIAAMFLFTCSVYAQEPLDALRYSMTGYGGTARARSIGGALVSLGGDLSAASVNPAGIAFYRTHEFVLTPSYSFGSLKTNYLNTETKGKNTTPDFNNIGLILPKSGSWNGNWRNFTYGVGMNKTINFSNTQKLSGLNTESSYSEKYLEELINNAVTDPNSAARNFPFGSSLAFNTFLVDTISGPNGTVNDYRSLSTPQTGVKQDQTVTTKGRINELFIAASGNYMDKLYVGGSLVFSQLRFERNTSFKESDATPLKNNFNYFLADDFLSTEGVGIGVKLGIIVRPVERIRIGISYHSPVLYNMEDLYNAKITTDLEGYEGNGVLTQSSADLNNGVNGRYQYDFINPMRLMAGVSYVFQEVEDITQQKGFISADIELINHSKSRFRQAGSLANNSNESAYLQQVNDAIANQFKSALNFRIGGELKFNTLMTRLGFNMMSNAYSVESLKARQMNISGGIGYRNKGYFIDLTYVHALTKDASFPYRLDNGFFAPGMISGSRGTILATIGLKF